MSRRRKVALASTVALLAIGGLGVGLVVGVTQTPPGQDWVRRTLLRSLAPRVHGRLTVGRISGNFLTGVTVDSLELRGPDDSLFVFVRRARVAFDPRDLLDRRVLLQRVELDRPVVRLSQSETGRWNYREILGGGGPQPPRSGRGFGDFIVADSVVVRDGSFLLTIPWHPADTLRGARRDSALAFNLARRDAAIRRRTASTFQRTYRWDAIQLVSPYVRLADPDSVGRYFALGRADADEFDPPFRLRNIAGGVRVLGESAWVRIRHFDLPGSTGHARGKVVWGSGLPNRYDFVVRGDSVSMRDIAWIYPTLPRTGSGSMTLAVRNDPRNLRVIDYALRDLDVRSTGSRLRGAMTYGVGGPVLVVKDLDLRADPVDFDLLRTLAGGPFPYDWQGTFTGTVRARGGRLDRFVVDEARLAYADRHVPGAVSRFTGRGGLDILQPAFTTFRGFAVDAEVVDLRTIQYLNRNFPRLGGTVSGRAVLDSSWLDVRFRDALLTHRDGPGTPNVVAGSGRVTYGDEMRYDLDLDGRELSLTTLARSYPALPFRGLVSGPIRAQGTVETLRLTTTLGGAAGRASFDGTIDAYEPEYAADGTFRFDALDLQALFEKPSLPRTQLAAAGTVALRGAAPADVTGTLALDVGRSTLDGARVYGGVARFTLGGGRLGVDTLDLETTAGRALASGGLGLGLGVRDSLAFRVSIDSLGGLRRWLAPRLAASAAADTVPDVFGGLPAADSLAGSVRFSGLLAGSLDTARAAPGLRLVAALAGRELVYGRTKVRAVDGTITVADARQRTGVAAALTADSLSVGRLALANATAQFVADSVDAAGAAPDPGGALGMRGAASAGVRVRAGRFALRAGTDSGAALAVTGRTTVSAESTLVVLDTARFVPRVGRAYSLAAPATVVARAAGNQLSLDSLVLRGPGAARFALGGLLQDTGAVRGELVAEGLAVGDVAATFGLATGTPPAADGSAAAPRAGGGARFDGLLDAAATLGGTRRDPLLRLRADGRDLTLAGAAVERLSAEGSYAARRLDATLDLLRGGARLVTARAALPLDLALLPGVRRTLPEALGGQVRADSMDLALLAALAPGVATDVRGRVRTALDLSGTWERPRLFGALRVTDGAAFLVASGTRFNGLAADVTLRGDTLDLGRVWARTGAPGDTVTLTGTVAFAPLRDPRLDLRLAARNVLAVDRPRLATLWVSTPRPLTVRGTFRDAVVRGAARLERGRIYIPELIDKRIVDLNEYRDVVDTTVFRDRQLLPGAPSAFVEGLTLDDVTLSVGNDVWLRSPETNIKLGGTLAVTRAAARDRTQPTQLALLGALDVERGTYRLNLLPLAQPVFDVFPGTLRFFGTGDLNPTLDVQAVHVVRQLRQTSNRPDVRVQVNIGGTLNQPTLRLSSADNPPISDTDLISYLVTGEPAAAFFGQAEGNTSGAAAASIVSRLAGSLVSGALSRGGPFDIVQVQTGSVTADPAQQRAAGENIASILASTRLGVGGQLGNRTFYTFSTGFCGLRAQEQQQGFLTSFYRGLGFRVERRITPSVSVQGSVEPGSQQLACLNDNSRFFFQQTPPQVGLDVSKTWSF